MLIYSTAMTAGHVQYLDLARNKLSAYIQRKTLIVNWFWAGFGFEEGYRVTHSILAFNGDDLRDLVTNEERDLNSTAQ